MPSTETATPLAPGWSWPPLIFTLPREASLEVSEPPCVRNESPTLTPGTVCNTPNISLPRRVRSMTWLVDSSQVMDLTLRGRDMFGVLQTVPGVNVGDSFLTQGGSETSSDASLGNVKINGGQDQPGANGVAVSVDGIMDYDPSSNSGTIFEPNMDSVAEMRV